jgi:dTDP-4-amino-4,6-dideoxygalactose transaminase
VPAHLAGAYADRKFTRGSFPISEELADTVLSLPIGPHLEQAQAAEIVKQTVAATQSLA